jgi:predicted ATPase
LDFKSQWGFERLRLALKGLIRTICKRFPIVLVLEDLQWADTESLTLLRTLVTDKQDKQFLFVGTTRGDGRGSTADTVAHYKVALLGEDKDGEKDQLHMIHLGDLSLHGVTEIVSSLLRKDPMDTQPLAELVHRKTCGNAFFVVQFLRLLYERQLIDFSLSTYRWEWDLDRIAAETVVADNVLDIVSGKILAMPKELQVALTRAAFLGPSRFDAEILLQTIGAHERKDDVEPDVEEVFCNDVTVLEDMLTLGVKEGLLEKLRPPRIYKFAHDRIKESAYALVPDGDARKYLHLYIGRQLRKLIDDKAATGLGTQVEDRLFLLAVRHLNLGSDFLDNEEEKVELAQLNSKAAEMAFEMSSFVPAGEYLQAGLSLLNTTTRWERHYALTLEVATALAHVRFCCGKMDSMRNLIDDILRHAKSLKDKLGAYRSMILCLFQEGDTVGARELTLDVLDQLGIHMPRRFFKLKIVMGILRTRRRLRCFSDDDSMACSGVR